MMYLTGRLAFGIPCSLDTPGDWEILDDEYATDEFKLVDSTDSPYGDWGIEQNVLVPKKEYCLYNVANHARAYLDMIYNKQFDELNLVFEKCIDNGNVRKDIFMMVLGKLRMLPDYDEYNKFMQNTFGNAWESYKQGVYAITMNDGKKYTSETSNFLRKATGIDKTIAEAITHLDVPNLKDINMKTQVFSFNNDMTDEDYMKQFEE